MRCRGKGEALLAQLPSPPGRCQNQAGEGRQGGGERVPEVLTSGPLEAHPAGQVICRDFKPEVAPHCSQDTGLGSQGHRLESWRERAPGQSPPHFDPTKGHPSVPQVPLWQPRSFLGQREPSPGSCFWGLIASLVSASGDPVGLCPATPTDSGCTQQPGT